MSCSSCEPQCSFFFSCGAMSSCVDWLHARVGQMPPSEQAKLWALRQVLEKQGEATDCYEWMSTQVHVVGEGSRRTLPCIKYEKQKQTSKKSAHKSFREWSSELNPETNMSENTCQQNASSAFHLQVPGIAGRRNRFPNRVSF